MGAPGGALREARLWGTERLPELLPPNVSTAAAAAALSSSGSNSSNSSSCDYESFLDDLPVSDFLGSLQQRVLWCSRLEKQLALLQQQQQQQQQLLRDAVLLHASLSLFSFCPEKFSSQGAQHNAQHFPAYRVSPAAAIAAGLMPLAAYGDSSSTVAAAAACSALQQHAAGTETETAATEPSNNGSSKETAVKTEGETVAATATGSQCLYELYRPAVVPSVSRYKELGLDAAVAAARELLQLTRNDTDEQQQQQQQVAEASPFFAAVSDPWVATLVQQAELVLRQLLPLKSWQGGDRRRCV